MKGRSSHLSPLQLMPSLAIEQKHLQLMALSIIQTTNFLLLFFCFCVEKNPSNQSNTTFGQLPILYCFSVTQNRKLRTVDNLFRVRFNMKPLKQKVARWRVNLKKFSDLTYTSNLIFYCLCSLQNSNPKQTKISIFQNSSVM